jgi:hypothetical protein
MRRLLIGVLFFAALAAGCSPGSSTDSTATSTLLGQDTSTTTVTTTAPVTTSTIATETPIAEQRWIAVDGDRFIDTRSGELFIPIGVNLLLKTGGGGGDRMFASYSPEWVTAQLDGIAALDMNTVRFFLDMCMSCTATSDGIREDYLDNLADLLTQLHGHGLVALPTSNDVPDPGFSERLPCCEPFGGYRNSLYLSPAGHDIAVEYWTELIEGLRERGAPTSHILGWQLANEQFVLRDVEPISLSTGSAITADGIEYNLAEDDEVEEMVVNNLRHYITTVGHAIREADPGALVTMGFFSADEPGAGRVANDNRWVVPAKILEESTLDFVDLHAYPGLGGTWDGIGAAYGLSSEPFDYPVILGEFGAFESAYRNADEGAAAMARWQVESCDYNFGGWLLWFWGADQDDEVITANVSDAAVGRAISPSVRPDPCDPGPYESTNLALGRPITASAEENKEYGVAKLVDGSDATWWSASAGPPQWAEIDLEEDRNVSMVEILIGDVSPPGPQTHLVWVRGSTDAAPGILAGEVSADAVQGDVLTVEFAPIPGVRFVRVETISMDGWVILHEVRVLGS